MKNSGDIDLNYHIVFSANKNLPELIKELGIAEKDINWSWYEPKPESLIGTNENKQTLTPILRKGAASIPEEIAYSELMFFFDDGGIVIIPTATGHRCFQFSEQPLKLPVQSKPGVLKCSRQTRVVFLRNQETLKKQFDLDMPDHYPETLQLIQYHHENNCIAWTLTDRRRKKKNA